MRVIVQGLPCPGRLDAVTGLLAAVRRQGNLVVHLDPAVDLVQAGKLFDRYRPQLFLRIGPQARIRPEEGVLLRSAGTRAAAWSLTEQPGAHRGVEEVLFTTGVVAGAGEPHVPEGAVLLPYGVETHLPGGFGSSAYRDHDALFLGHATGKEHRHAVARAVLRQADAGCIGAGWPRAWLGQPSGVRLLTLLRRCPVHVHFEPGPDAVLGVAAGGLPAVPVDSAVEQQLASVPGLVRFSSGTELAARIQELVARPDALDSRREAAARTARDEHSYDRRWQQLVSHAGLDGPADGQRPRRVIVSGWYGAGNLGDELILRSLADRIESQVPGGQVVVAARHPMAVLQTHGLEAFERVDSAIAAEQASRATAVLLGGGGLWEDYTFARNGGVAGIVTGATASPSSLAVLPLLAGIQQRPTFVEGVGVGPLTDPGAQAIVRFVGNNASCVTVRDEPSRDQLLAIDGWANDVQVAPDLVYGLGVPQLPPSRLRREPASPLIAVNLRPWDVHESDLADAVDGALRTLAAERNARLVGVPLDPKDAGRLTAVLARLGPEHVVLPHVLDLPQVLADLSACDALLSMRLHGCLLGHRAGSPVIGLGYDPKVSAHFEQLGRGEYQLPLTASADQIVTLVASALDEGLPGEVSERVRRLERDAETHLDDLVTRLGGIEPPPEPSPAAGWVEEPVPGDLTISPHPIQVRGGNTLVPGRVPGVRSARVTGTLVFGLTDSGPLAGDCSTWETVVPAAGSGSGRSLHFQLHCPYGQNPKMSGRLAWQVLVDDRIVLTEDVAGWGQPFACSLGWGPGAGDVRVAVRVLSLRDCEDARWGRAAGLVVGPLRVSAWPAGATLAAGEWSAACSSPGARVLR